ncbi:MAG TPA: alkaline phosphatase family protein [Polyangia bacterium]|nr:alkaline phosphatase family protein [Polyangia bacterium]
MRGKGMVGAALLGWLAGCGGNGGGGGSARTVRDAFVGDAFAGDASGGGATLDASSARAHVFVVAMENENIGQVFGDMTDAPYINGMLIPTGARATTFVDELPPGSPSEPHYVWMEAGTNAFADHTFTTDSAPSATNSTASTAHLVTQIDGAGLSWTAYEEGIDATTGSCPVAGAGFYAPKHDPFVFFRDLAGSPPAKTTPACAAHFKDLPALSSDLSAGAIGDYVFITPNLCHDMHGATGCPDSDLIRAGDGWLGQNLPPILAFAEAHGGVVFVLWDEGDPSGRMPFLALGPEVKPGYAGAVMYTHGSVLKTVEEMLGLPVLPTVAGVDDLSDLFASGRVP